MLYKCRNCGGELHFDPRIGKLKCEFCDAEYPVSDYEAEKPPVPKKPSANASRPDQTEQAVKEARRQGYTRATDDSTDLASDLALFSCPHCGAQVVTDRNTVATTCVFCSTPLVLEQQMQAGFTPEMIIPFAVDKRQIEKLYERYIASKPFYPEEYSKANVIQKIQAFYLPFWLYTMDVEGDLQASGEKTWTRTTSQWIITEHDVFFIDLAGGLQFDKVPVIASSKTPRNAMDALEPFDYSKLVPYNSGYLPGFLASRYDCPEEMCSQSAKERAQHSFEKAMLNTLHEYQAVKITGGQTRFHLRPAAYALLPAYLLFMDYDNEEDRLIAINGQTGKIVGNIPVDRRKRILFFLLRFLLLWLGMFAILITLLIFID